MGWSHNITNNIQWVKSYVQFWQVEGISFPYFFVAPTIPELYVAETNQPSYSIASLCGNYSKYRNKNQINRPQS